MVEHDESRVQMWLQTREMQSRHQTTEKGMALHLPIVAVQSIACCVAVLLAMLLRVAGGDAYCSLRQRFQQALVGNEWIEALALLWDGDPLAKLSETDVKSDTFTDVTHDSLEDEEQTVVALAPLATGILTSDYGERIHPIDGTREFHTGVDVAAPLGTALLAVCDGEVTEVGEDAQLGKYICLDHGEGVEIVYGHCEEIVAMQGAQVRAGERVALVGSTGVSTGSHVHIRVHMDGVVCDPKVLLPLNQYA